MRYADNTKLHDMEVLDSSHLTKVDEATRWDDEGCCRSNLLVFELMKGRDAVSGYAASEGPLHVAYCR